MLDRYPHFINLQISLILRYIRYIVKTATNQSVDCENQTANQKPRNFVILANNQRENSNWSEPSRDIQKRGLGRKSKV